MKRSTIIIGVGVFLYFVAVAGKIYHIHKIVENQLHEDTLKMYHMEFFSLGVNHPISDLECLAQNIYFEARNQSEKGQRAVAWVTLNRVDHKDYPDTICKVVWQHKQFSWTHDGKSDNPKEKRAWNKAKLIARTVLSLYKYRINLDPSDGALYYHANYVKPLWNTHYNLIVEIDNHVFYQ